MFEYLDPRRPRRALLIGMGLPGITAEEARASLYELAQLAYTAEIEVCDHLLQTRDRVDPTYYIGKGKAAQLASVARDHDAGLLIFDNDLSPAQMRNLEELTGQRILDRSLLILDIFARNARTRVAQLQVERAQLEYLLPRLTRQWKHLSRQAGGKGGNRGPGETQLETDRRNIRQRLTGLSENLQQVRKQMDNSRKRRKEIFKVTLVGYTNSGKSTLMRVFSGAEVLIQDQLFATLDSTTRSVELDSPAADAAHGHSRLHKPPAPPPLRVVPGDPRGSRGRRSAAPRGGPQPPSLQRPDRNCRRGTGGTESGEEAQDHRLQQDRYAGAGQEKGSGSSLRR